MEISGMGIPAYIPHLQKDNNIKNLEISKSKS